MADGAFPVHRDDRGELVVVEGDGLGFDIRRVFTVSGTDGGGARGGHVAGCTELVVLVTGSAHVRVRRPGQPPTHHLLDEPGRAVTLRPEDHVEYDLDGAGSVIVVLCDEPYRSRP